MSSPSSYPLVCQQCRTKDVWPVSISGGHERLAIRLKCRACQHEWTTESQSDRVVTPVPSSPDVPRSNLAP